MAAEGATPFSWSFIDDVGRWSIAVAAVAIVVGTLVTGQMQFAVACTIGAAVDIGLLRLLTRRGRAASESPQVGSGALGALFGVRIAVKAVLITLASLMPDPGWFWGMVVGVLVAEFTMMTVGAVVAARGVMSGHVEGPS